VKISKRQLRRIIKEERTKLLKEYGTAPEKSYGAMMQKATENIITQFYDDMLTMYERDPDAFGGQSKGEWEAQVVYAQQDLDTQLLAAMERVFEEIENTLHDGGYTRYI
jgi:hypothetical protein